MAELDPKTKAALAKIDEYLADINKHTGALAFRMKDINLLIGKTRMWFEARKFTKDEAKVKNIPKQIEKLNDKHDIVRVRQKLILVQDLKTAESIVKYHLLTLHSLLFFKRLLFDMNKFEESLIKKHYGGDRKILEESKEFVDEVHKDLVKMRKLLFALDAEIRGATSIAGNLSEINFFDSRILNYLKFKREIKHEVKDISAIEKIQRFMESGKSNKYQIRLALKKANDEVDNTFRMFKLSFLLMHVILHQLTATEAEVKKIAAKYEIPISLYQLDTKIKKKIKEATMKLINNIKELILVLFGEESKVEKKVRKLKKG